MTRPRELADLVGVARRTAAAAQRRVEAAPRDAAAVLAEIDPVRARLADLDAAAAAAAEHAKRCIAAGLDRMRQAPAGRPFVEAQQEADRVNRSAAYALQAIVAEARALRLLHDQLVGELADARARATV